MKELDCSPERVSEVVGIDPAWAAVRRELSEPVVDPGWMEELEVIHDRFQVGQQGTKLELRKQGITGTDWLWALLVKKGIIAIVGKVPWAKERTLNVYRRVR